MMNATERVRNYTTLDELQQARRNSLEYLRLREIDQLTCNEFLSAIRRREFALVNGFGPSISSALPCSEDAAHVRQLAAGPIS
jgi:hypothetical protein